MRQATLSILGLYRYDPTLFDNFQIPEALDKSLLIDNLLLECAELEVVYPDLDFLKFIIGRWSAKCLPVWNKLYETTVLKYDPIENYNRIEEWEETGTGTGSSSGTSNSDTTNAGTSTLSNVAFNTDVFKDTSKQTDSNTSNNDTATTSTMSTSFENNTTKSATQTRNTERGENNNVKHTGRIHGNIGVTTSQQMIQAEREVALFNIYDVIISDFKSKFCIGVY